MHKNTTLVSLKAVFSVDIPLLKPCCSDSSKLLNATRWSKVLHKSLSNTSEKHHVFVVELYDLSYENETQSKTDFLKHVAYKSKPLAGKTTSQNGKLFKGAIMDICF